MNRPEPARDVIDQLNQLLVSDRLPDAAAKTATELAKRLSSQVRVTLLGPPGVGKSTLCNVLAGTHIIPADQKLPTTMLRHGDRERVIVTLGDRSVKTLDGLDFRALQGLSPAYVEVEAPVDALLDFSLLEVVTDGTPAELAAATRWAATRTDIAIWLTTEFGADERAAWSRTPEERRDHAYLVLNRIDEIPAEQRASRTSGLRAAANEAFHAFFPVSALAVGAAMGQGGEAEVDGCDALLKALKRHVSLASQADLDRAAMFLARFGAKDRTGSPAPTDKPNDRGSKQSAHEEKARVSDPDRPSLQLEQVAFADQTQDGVDTGQAQTSALNCLRGCAIGVMSDWNALGPDIADAVLDRCIETIENVVETLPAEDRFHGSALQASDLILLLQLENSDGAAEHAVSTLLQLKREIEVNLAA